jgi:hypothetical protein
MARRVGTLTQCLIGGGEIVLACRIQFVRRDSLRKRFGGQAVIARRLIQQADDVQRGRLPGVERERTHFKRAGQLPTSQSGSIDVARSRRRISGSARLRDQTASTVANESAIRRA